MGFSLGGSLKRLAESINVLSEDSTSRSLPTFAPVPTHPLFRVRYWRAYPWPLQLLLLLLLVFTFASLFTAIALVVVPALTGHSVADTAGVSKDSPRSLINAALLGQALTHAGIFLLPALLYAYLSHPAPGGYLGLRKPGRLMQWLLVPGCILGAAPVFLWMDAFARKWSSGAAQETNDRLTEAFVSTQTSTQLALSLLVVALLPALGEETFFRGVLYRFIAKRAVSSWVPVVASAAFFTVVHYNPSGLAAIFLAGVLFALFYQLTGSLWPGIAAHFLYNGAQVVAIHYAQARPALITSLEKGEIPLSFVLVGLLLFSLCFYLLWRTRTPLPPGWALDEDAPQEASLQP